MGKLSRSTGATFEREIARRLRQIYDPSDLLTQLEAATPQTRPKLLLQSSVRRGDQRRGAREPDIVTPSTWWLELQCKSPNSGGKRDGTDKLNQAQRDIMGRPDCPWYRPAVVERRKGSPRVWVTMPAHTLAATLGYDIRADTLIGLARDMPTTISWEAFETILASEKDREQRNPVAPVAGVA